MPIIRAVDGIVEMHPALPVAPRPPAAPVGLIKTIAQRVRSGRLTTMQNASLNKPTSNKYAKPLHRSRPSLHRT